MARGHSNMENTMSLFIHTSPEAKIEMNSSGVFGTFLFFVHADSRNDSGYEMASGKTYRHFVTVDCDDIAETCDLFSDVEDYETCAEYIKEVCDTYDTDEDGAVDLLTEKESVFIDADASWRLQHLTALCAVAQGWRGVCVEDEQGSAYMIDMSGETLNSEDK
jgi:hypothetical protein